MSLNSVGLRHDSVNFVETVALSAAVMAPSASMALNVSLIGGLVGTSVCLPFLLATVITLGMSVSIIHFNQVYPNSGSLYSFTKVGLGRSLSWVSGWSLYLAYLTLVIGVSGALGSYVSTLLSMLDLHVSWLPLSLMLTVVMWIFSYRDIKLSTKVMLALEGVSISLIVILATVIFVKTVAGGHWTWKPFTLPIGHGASLAEGTVVALLCFAGFESSSTLGEEAAKPTRTIPLVIAGTIIGIALFFLLSSDSQELGYLARSSMGPLADSTMPLVTLASYYVSPAYATLTIMSLTLSLFSCVVGCACTSSRLMFAMARDRSFFVAISSVHPIFRTPHRAVHSTMAVSVITQVLFDVLIHGRGTDLYNYTAYVTALSMLLSYALVNASAVRHFFLRSKRWPSFLALISALSLVAALYAIYANLYPVPPYPMNLAPYITVVFITIMCTLSWVSSRVSTISDTESITTHHDAL
ncbi:APC family permease [Alicyclobacillus mali (ex Roth et al. 2021)]|uniref:APC family permease n=1 Tax=Alicyclobacillus mali (ex Roth et al. 2021) TaxID=1123961 RepID=UPI001A8F8163|nr:APC family permease [Alicyclobacillus mali (ex Roth et al. 2021)]